MRHPPDLLSALRSQFISVLKTDEIQNQAEETESMTSEQIESEQKRVCRAYKTDFVPCEDGSKVGIALATLRMRPLNGLRHIPERGTNGWYIWGGEELSSRADFFDALHIDHVPHRCPGIVKYLGLPPGYRFLVAPDHLDVWFDVNLLNAS
jgi:hypothetical protein